jgi:hypothetical protein
VITFRHRGSFGHIEKFLNSAKKFDIRKFLAPYGEQGVRALAAATPRDTGLTAGSWGYEIVINKASVSIIWTNSNVVDGVPVAIVLQYGHGTRNGGFVQGADYINPALRPVFDRISEEVRREVSGG